MSSAVFCPGKISNKLHHNEQTGVYKEKIKIISMVHGTKDKKKWMKVYISDVHFMYCTMFHGLCIMLNESSDVASNIPALFISRLSSIDICYFFSQFYVVFDLQTEDCDYKLRRRR